MNVHTIHDFEVSYDKCPQCGTKDCKMILDNCHSVSLVLPKSTHDLGDLSTHICHFVEVVLPSHKTEFPICVKCEGCGCKYNREGYRYKRQ